MEQVVDAAVENPDYVYPTEDNPYVPPKDRPEEYTAVGLLGKLMVRYTGKLQPGDYVAAGKAGVGVKATDRTRVRVLSVILPAKGTAQGVVFCLLR